MVSRAKRNGPTEQIDFFGQRVAESLPRIQTLQQDLEPILKLVTLYTDVLDQNGSVAKHLHIPLISTRIEDRVSGLFSSSQPLIVDAAGDDDHLGSPPSWVDVIRESKTIDQIHLHDQEQYRIPVRGATVEVSKSDWDILSSNVLQRLLGTAPEPEDVQAELRAREDLMEDLTALGESVSEVNAMIQTMLQILQEQPQTANGDSVISESPALHVETMCDNDAASLPALDFEMIIDKDMDDDFRDRQASITPATPETTTESASKGPLKLISAWSPLEKRRLRDFLSTRGHLSWSRIALEYEAKFHKGRSASSIAGQARSLGLSVGHKSSKKRTRTVRRDPLVLKVRVPHVDKLSSCEEATSARPAQTPTTPYLEEPNPSPNSSPSHELQDCSSPPADSHTIRPRVSPDSFFPLPPSARNDHMILRHTDHDLPRSFDLILN